MPEKHKKTYPKQGVSVLVWVPFLVGCTKFLPFYGKHNFITIFGMFWYF